MSLLSSPPSSATEPSAPPPRPGLWRAWQVAARPRSLWVALAPVLVGAALGWRRGGMLDGWAAAAALLAALLMQLITNLQNDVGFTHRGAHRVPGRIGLPRATALGWLSVGQVRAMVGLLSALAIGFGLFLVWWKGWPVLWLGTASLLAALAYMGGPKPIAYTPLGELTVLVFFGLVAVLGTEWLLSGGFDTLSVLAALALGSLAAAALAINNLRDRAHDAELGRRTLAVCLGPAGARRACAGLLLAPFALLPLMAWQGGSLLWLAPVCCAPAAHRLQRELAACTGPEGFTPLLLRAFRFEFQFAAVLALAALLQRALSGA